MCSRWEENSKLISIICLLLGILALCVGFLGPYLIDWELDNAIKKLLVIDSTEAQGWRDWESTAYEDSVPFWYKFYVFNITNPVEAAQGLEKPKLYEMGPYSYRKYKIKFNVTWSDDGDIISYKTYLYFKFDPTQSCSSCTTEDRFTTVNVPYAIIRGNLGYNWWESLAFDVLASRTNSSIFINVNVNDFCVSGYQDSMFQFLSSFGISGVQIPQLFSIQPNMTNMEMADNLTKHDMQYTGKKDMNKINVWYEYQEQKELSLWGSKWANRLAGTDGYQFPPKLKQSTIVEAFIDTTMRVVSAESNETVENKGIEMYRFRLSPVNMLNSTLYPSNAGYYQFGPSGVINRTSSAMLAPLFLSKPHYLDADPFYREQVEGLSPNRTAHDTWIDVEPTTGTAMNAVERIQISIIVKPDYLLNPNFPETYVPTIWIEQYSTITEPLAKTFKDKVYTALGLSKGLKYGGWVSSGVLLLVCLVFLAIYLRLRKRKEYVMIQ